MTTLSSGLTTTHAFTSGPANAAEASVPNGMWNPTASPAVAEPARKVRRLMLDISFIDPSLYAFAAEWIAVRTCW